MVINEQIVLRALHTETLKDASPRLSKRLKPDAKTFGVHIASVRV